MRPCLKTSTNISNNCSTLVLEHLTFLRDPDFFAKRRSGLPLLPHSTTDSLLYQTDVQSLFSQLGCLLEVTNSDIHGLVLRGVKFHLTNSAHFIVSCIENSCFTEKLCKVMRLPTSREAKAEAMDVCRLLADKCTGALVKALEEEGVAMLCTDVPDKSVLSVNETLSVVLLYCSNDKLLVKAGEDCPVYAGLCKATAADAAQPMEIRKRASSCLSHSLLKGLKGTHDENSIRSLFSGVDEYLQRCKDCADLNGVVVHLCLAITMSGDPSTQKMLLDLRVIKVIMGILEQCIDCEDSSVESIVFEGLLCLSLLCDGSTERCLSVSCNGIPALIALLIRLQTRLYNQECLALSDWVRVEQPLGMWSSLHRLVICAVKAVQSCVENCSESRRLFIQRGGVMVLLNILEWMPPEFTQPILRCVCTIYEQENSVKNKLISWRGVRRRSAIPIDETLFDKHETKTLTLEEELVLRLNDYRIGWQRQIECNLATHLCWLWRWNEERIRQSRKHAPPTQEWSPLMKFQDLSLLIYLLLRVLDFGKDFHLDVDDQVTMADIENFPNTMEDEIVKQIQVDLRRCGVNPIIEDRERLEKTTRTSQIRAEEVTRKKLAIIKAAIEYDTCREAELYVKPREIMKHRRVALQREVNAQLKMSNYACLCASRRKIERAIYESRHRCQGGGCVTSTTIETTPAVSSPQLDVVCNELDATHSMTEQKDQIRDDQASAFLK
ncbi:hypothetical protein TcWFU_009823 [Taenia crassiceps]|uniref:Cilia- and flagella-associated protein 69 ARM repeats domain-containing protein n=1 Tax=Taenia crassiceps TaxID=6207 RepID=A0ABR4Q8D9_9CEST